MERELRLENSIERAVALTSTERIVVDDLPEREGLATGHPGAPCRGDSRLRAQSDLEMLSFGGQSSVSQAWVGVNPLPHRGALHAHFPWIWGYPG